MENVGTKLSDMLMPKEKMDAIKDKIANSKLGQHGKRFGILSYPH